MSIIFFIHSMLQLGNNPQGLQTSFEKDFSHLKTDSCIVYIDFIPIISQIRN